MRTKTYEGFIKEKYYEEAYNIIFLSNNDKPLAETLMDDICSTIVTVRYYVSTKIVTLEEAQEDFINQLIGVIDVDYATFYSEYTGYLWTDEKIVIGGHDLLDELRSYVGKYLILVVDIHDIGREEVG